MSVYFVWFLTIVSLLIGAIMGYFTRRSIARHQVGTAEEKITSLTKEAKNKSEEIILKAQKESVKLLEDTKKELRQKEGQILKREKRIEEREIILDKKDQETRKEYDDLKLRVEKISQLKQEVEKIHQSAVQQLEKISSMTKDEAKEKLLKKVEEDYQNDILERIKKLESEGRMKLEERAREIIALAMQKYSNSQANELTTSSINLPSDDLKGRIIGKEGRNIKAFEKATGVDVLVDDTPEVIVLSCFNPLRRQVAKTALNKLIADGRIQPARIEEVVQKAKEELGQEIYQVGEKTAFNLGIHDLPTKLIQLLGRLKYRTSYGQNVLQHSVEVAYLSEAIAAELGANVKVAKEAGLLHDIGKAIDFEVEGSHVEIGRTILKKFGISDEIIKAMQSHHEEYPPESVEATIVTVADAISSARPGARRDTVEAYLKRIRELEDVAKDFPGVEKVYAIQSGREVRVFVRPQEINDLEAHRLARDVADRVQEELRYPGEIRITVIRETRVIEYAK